MRVKRRVFCGAVCEQEVYTVSDRIRDPGKAEPQRPRFQTEEDRLEFNRQVSLRKLIRSINTNCNPSWLYLTLTISDEWEVHTFQEASRLEDLFIRRLRRINPNLEYYMFKGRGKGTKRIHFHLLINGIKLDRIKEKWTFGVILNTEDGTDHHLREHNYYDGVDHGMDYTGLAVYLFNHWTEEQGKNSHRWRASRNLREPEAEEAKEVKRVYTDQRPPVPPKGYIYIGSKSTHFGYQCFRYVQATQAPPPGRPPKSNTLL